MAYRKTYKTEIDDELLRHLPVTSKSEPFSDFDVVEWDSISSLQQKMGLRLGTLRASLRRLCEAGLVHRAWDGNERFGRYVYVRRVTNGGDFRCENHGSVILLYPLTPPAFFWVEQHLPDAQSLGTAVVVEHRFIGAILDGLRSAGLTVTLEAWRAN